jgi:hypothetical protein
VLLCCDFICYSSSFISPVFCVSFFGFLFVLASFSFGKIQFTPLKFQEFFNLNPKISKLAVYLFEVSKSGNLNLPLKWTEIFLKKKIA